MTAEVLIDAMREAFPEANPGIVPFGSRVLVQIRTPKTKTASGIIIDNGSRDTEKWNTQVARVVSLGPLWTMKRLCGCARSLRRAWPLCRAASTWLTPSRASRWWTDDGW